MNYLTRNTVCIGASITIFMLAGCGNGLSEHSLSKKINASIGQKSICWSLENMAVDFPVRVGMGFGAGSGPQNDPIIRGLDKAGYITLASGGADFLGNVTTVSIDLTDKGRSAKVWNPQAGFCVGHKAVDTIKQWTEPAAEGGSQITRISYSWKIVDQPDWVDKKLFAGVEGMSQPVDAMAIAEKTNDGWQLVGY